MSNILFIYETNMPTVGITRNYWTNISGRYNVTTKFIKLIDVTVSEINWCDVLIMIRPNNSLSWRVAEKARYAERFVITMCDDDLLNLPRTYPDLAWQKNGLIKALNQSDAIMSSSKYLIDKMICYTKGKRKAYINTVINSFEILKRNYDSEISDCIKLVYAAGRQHEELFEQYVLPSLTRIAKQTKKKLSITFINVHPKCGILEQVMNIEYIEGMPLLEYRHYMEERKFDIGVAPLEDNNFAKCKYFNKFLEYTLSGIVGIYSNVEPYTYVVKDGENGFLADNTMTSWEEKLLSVIEDNYLRHKCALNAQEFVRDNFNEELIMNRLFSALPELKVHNHDNKKCTGFGQFKLLYRLLRIIEYLYKTFFYLRNEGFDSVKRKSITRLSRLCNKL